MHQPDQPSRTLLDAEALIARIKAAAAADEQGESRQLGNAAAPVSASTENNPDRTRQLLASIEPPSLLSLPPLASVPAATGTACLGDLLSPFDDADFIAGAYRVLLGREPDTIGAQVYGDYLRQGGSRLLVLYALRYSPEGKAHACVLDAAPIGWLYRAMPMKRLLGPWLRRVERAYLRRHPEFLARSATNQLAHRIDASHRELVGWLRHHSDQLVRQHQALMSFQQQGEHLGRAIDALNIHGERWGGAIEELRRDGERWGGAIEELRRDGERWGGAIEELRRDGERWGGAIEQLRTDSARQGGQLAQLEQQQAPLRSQQEHLRGDTRNLADRANAIESAVAQLRGGAEWLQRQLDEAKDALERIDTTAAEAQAAIGTEVARRERLSKDLDFIRSDLIYHRGQARDLIAALRANAAPTASTAMTAAALQSQSRSQAIPIPAGSADDDRLDAYYVAFEEEFRGAPEQIRETQEGYIADLRDAGTVSAATPVLDLGCGRGEWLALLVEHGLSAKGVDTNAVMVARCREQGLDAREVDALTALQALPDASLGAVSAFHLIEHLPFSLLHALLEQAHRVLRPGGVLVLETPNPENLLVGSHTFYHDPTHRNPMTPTATRFLVRYLGFTDPEIRRLHPYPDSAKVPGNDPLTERVNGHLCGPQDYAIIARKPKPA
ncbi:MAG: hypothetical protein C1943_11330 [Halochromatium sp.]|nr:hypothetical protein [Halochromatium sp.]